MHSFLYSESERRLEELSLAERDCRRMLEPLEQYMKGRDYFVGPDLSVADFIGAYTLDRADTSGFLDQSPVLKAFVERMYVREAAPPKISEGFAVLESGGVAPPRRHVA